MGQKCAEKLRNEELYNPNSLQDIIYEIKGDCMWETNFTRKNIVKMGHLENLDLDGVITLK